MILFAIMRCNSAEYPFINFEIQLMIICPGYVRNIVKYSVIMFPYLSGSFQIVPLVIGTIFSFLVYGC